MEHQTGILILLFVIATLIIGAITRHIFKGTPVPYSVVLLVIGLAIGVLERTGAFTGHVAGFGHAVKMVSEIDPHLILFLFLPPLIFESAFAMEPHLFKRTFPQTALLAVPGLIMSTCLTAALAKFLFPWDWSWPLCLMFGALISATDPVAVVSLLKEMSSRKRLETLIEGESLLNDGTAIVFFGVFYGIMLHGTTGDTMDTISKAAGQFTWVVSLGLGIGLVIGWMAIQWIGRVFNDAMIEITISIAAAYSVFMLAEGGFHVSGVVGVVTLALLLSTSGRTRISPEVEEFLHHFWEMMSYIANTIIFVIVGVVIADRVQFNDTSMWLTLGLLYLGTTIIRGFSIGFFSPILKRIGIGISFTKMAVLTWGGLRGAVALAMALAVAQDPLIPKAIGDQVLFLCAGIVVLTIMINGSTMRPLMKKLGIDHLPAAKEVTVQKARRNIRQALSTHAHKMQGQRFMGQVNWKKIHTDFRLDEEEVKSYEPDEFDEASKEDLEVAYRRRLLEAERKDYWNQFKEGLLSEDATFRLVSSVEKALDEYPTIHPRPELKKVFRGLGFLVWLNRFSFIHRIALRMSFSKLALGYNVARGFLHSTEQCRSYAGKIAPNPVAEEKVKKEIELNRKDILAKINQLGATFPEVLSTLETRVATRTLLNKERQIIEHMVEEGVLDKPEAEKMTHDVEMKMRELPKLPSKIKPPNPASLLKQMEWISGLSQQTVDKILGASSARVYDSEKVLMEQGGKDNDLFIVARGAVEVYRDGADGREVIDVVGPGAVIGEMSMLTGHPHNASVKSKSPVEVLWLSSKNMKPIIDADQALKQRMDLIMQKRIKKVHG
jgi:NhaP-type Na+/H+ or K+/H+ antiporter